MTSEKENAASFWSGKFKASPLRVALCIFNNDFNTVSIAISSISAYIKREHPDIIVKLFHINTTRNEESYLPEGFSEYIKNWQPNLFAASVLSTHWDGIQPYLVAVKSKLPDTAILIGGYQAILKSEETIHFPPVDFICDGDGEIPTSNLISYLSGKSKEQPQGIWEKFSDGSVVKTPKYNLEDLSLIPLPDYEIYEQNGKIKVNNLTMARTGKVVLPIMTGRGCVYNCTYCSNSTLRKNWPNKKTFIRKYEIEALTDEFARLRDKYEVGYFEFWDELFFSDLDYSMELFELYKKKVGIPFSVVSRIDVMDFDLCKKAADAGCDAIYFGLESGNEEYRKKYLKRFDKNEQILSAAENCRLNGIKRITFNIVGMPFETKQQMLDTLELNKKINPEFFYFFIYIPLKGTQLYDLAEKHGLLYDKLRTVHYQDGIKTGRIKMNIREVEGSATEDELNEVCKIMFDFQQQGAMLKSDSII